jgi:cytokinin riboside 5'-monophosphate phosphoribohydrolase
MSMLNRVCVFCGSAMGARPAFREAAAALGGELATRRLGLVFGGGSVGLMGIIADAVLAAGGEVIGVIPLALATKEVLHPGVRDMRRVRDMHERKAVMAENADAFVALPGGYGTFEELFEVITWAQLGFHRKNIGLLNVEGYFDPLVKLIEQAIETGFIKPSNRELIFVEREPSALLDRLATHQMPIVRRWLSPDET